MDPPSDAKCASHTEASASKDGGEITIDSKSTHKLESKALQLVKSIVEALFVWSLV